MKYGRAFESLLSETPEWRSSSVQYKELKKLVGRVAAELRELGLTHDVLHELLSTPAHESPAPKHLELPTLQPRRSSSPSRRPSNRRRRQAVLGKGKARARAEYEVEQDDTGAPRPRIKLVFSSTSSSGSATPDDEALLQRLRESVQAPAIDSSDIASSAAESPPHEDGSEGRFEEISESDHDSEGLPDSVSPDTILSRLYGHNVQAAEDTHQPGSPIDNAPTIPGANERPSLRLSLSNLTLRELDPPSTARPALSDAASDGDDEGLDDPRTPRGPRSKRRRHRRRREITVPLANDAQFLAMLSNALQRIETLELEQKSTFVEEVTALTREVSKLATPSSRKDLNAWREAFALWIEAQIFESDAERDRGERKASEAATRMQWFVNQVGLRKLATRMRHKEGRAALEQFVALNIRLLNLKRFSEANEEAARKILKKHDKRSGLTASAEFPAFVAAAHSISAPNEVSSAHLVLPGQASLPHVLVSTFTTVLLPIIPQVDDYSCLICGEVAFKPIRLECGHRFCVRCLVKMQKRGQDACPSCRAPVVLRADATNLDAAMQDFLLRWFPDEVKRKRNENEREVAQEELQELGLGGNKCTVS